MRAPVIVLLDAYRGQSFVIICEACGFQYHMTRNDGTEYYGASMGYKHLSDARDAAEALIDWFWGS